MLLLDELQPFASPNLSVTSKNPETPNMANCRTNRLTMLLIGCCLLGTSMLVAAVESRGSRACAAWLEDRLEETEGHSQHAEIDQTWLVGYLSGVVAGSGIDFLVGTDNALIFSKIDDYCQAHPREDLARAGTALARELMRQKGIVNVPTLP